MSMTVKAIMKCTAKTADKNVRLEAVYANNKGEPILNEWSQYTPYGNVYMNVSNPTALEQFVEGEYYAIDFTRVDVNDVPVKK